MKFLKMLGALCVTLLLFSCVKDPVNPEKPDQPDQPDQPDEPAELVDLTVPVPAVDKVDQTTAVISWAAVEHAAGYECILGDGDAKKVEKSSIEYKDLLPGTRYEFKVRALTSDEKKFKDSAWSEVLAFETEKKEEDKPENPEAPFVLKVSETTFYNTFVDVTPADDEMTYYFSYISVSDYGMLGSDQALMDSNIQAIKELAATSGKTFGDMFLILNNVGMNRFEVRNLSAETEYYVFAFGFDIEGNITSGLVKESFKTLADPGKPESDMKLEILIEDKTATEATVKVVPSRDDEYYFFAAVHKNSVPGSDDAAVLDYYVTLFNDFVASDGFDVFAQQNLSKGTDSYRYNSLLTDNEYIVYAFGVAMHGNRLVSTTPLNTLHFMTESETETPTDDLIGIKITELTATAVSALFTPKAEVDGYLCEIVLADAIKDMTDEQIADYVIELHGGADVALYTMQYDAYELKSIMDNYTPDTEYVALAFGMDSNLKLTTPVYRKTARTLAQ